jgi:hypothetical protein
VPYGGRRVGSANGPTITPRLTELVGDPRSLPAQLDAGQDSWRHFTFSPAELLAGAGTIDLLTPATRVKVIVREDVAVFIGLDRTAEAGAGGYDLIQPGLGELDESIPWTTRVSLAVDPDAVAPTLDVDVWTMAGVYTARPT